MNRNGDHSRGDPGTVTPSILPRGFEIGHYVVERLVAVGGYAEVYRALDTRDSAPVALKLLRPEIVVDPARARRLMQEAGAYKCLRHPRIIALREILDHESRMVLVTEWVDGVTLAERIASGPLPPEEASEIMLRVAEGLAVAHAAGLAHRDLKPENIMVTETGEVKLLDFGLAKAVGEGVFSDRSWETVEGTIVGTPPYMAPEQVRGEKAGLAADVFAFGTVFYEAVTGLSPFLRQTATATLHAVAAVEFPRLRGVVGRRLKRIIHSCLQADPGERPPDAIALVSLLRPAPARNNTGSRRLQAASVGAAALLALLAAWGGIVFRWPHPTIGQGLRVFPAEGVSPVLARDGRTMAFVSRDGREIWIASLRSGNPRLVFAGSQKIGALAMSPSGQTILFDCPDDAGGRWVWELAVTGGTPRKVVRGRSPAVSPDGSTVACLQGKSKNGHDLVMSLLDGSDRRVVRALPGPQVPLSMGFLPNGRELILSTTDWVHSSMLLRVDLSTGQARTVVELRGIASQGLTVVAPLNAVLWPLRRTAEESGVLGLTDLKKGGYSVVYPGPGRVSDPSSSADLEKLLFRSVHQQREIVEVAVDPDSGRVATSFRPVPNTTGGGQPRVSPDGTWFAFQSSRGDVWLSERANGSTGPLLTTGEASFNPAWSPDSALVAYGCLKGSKSQIWLAGADGSDPQPLTSGDFNDFQPAWHPDRVHIVFVSDRGGRDQLFRLHVPSGETVQLTDGGAVNPAVSLDGRFVAFVEVLSPGQGVVRLHDLNEDVSIGRQIWEMPVEIGEWAGGKPRFSPDGRWVALDLPTQPLGADIWAAPTTPEGPDRLVRLTEFQFPARTHAWFDWAPDGHLLVTVDRQEDRLLYFSDARGWLERALR